MATKKMSVTEYAEIAGAPARTVNYHLSRGNDLRGVVARSRISPAANWVLTVDESAFPKESTNA